MACVKIFALRRFYDLTASYFLNSTDQHSRNRIVSECLERKQTLRIYLFAFYLQNMNRISVYGFLFVLCTVKMSAAQLSGRHFYPSIRRNFVGRLNLTFSNKIN